jgi:fructokinase
MPDRIRAAADQVLSVGEVLIDVIAADGATSLEAAERFVARAGGAPANVAVALARLGVSSAFCGVVGADPFGDKLRHELTMEGIDVTRLRVSEGDATTIAFAWKDARGDGHFWLLRGADRRLSVRDADTASIADLAALAVGSVSLSAEPSRRAIEKAVALARSSAVPVVFDVNLRPTLWSDLGSAATACQRIARYCEVVKLSLDDAQGLLGCGVSPAAALDAIVRLGPASVVLTDGERGCWFATREQATPVHVPAYVVNAVEPTGAGDAFTAALIFRSLASRWATLTESDVRFAAAAGALATTRPGAWDGLPNRQQLDAFLAAS